MKISNMLFKAARLSRDLSAATSGSPKRVARGIKNKVVGRTTRAHLPQIPAPTIMRRLVSALALPPHQARIIRAPKSTGVRPRRQVIRLTALESTIG